MAGWPMVRLGAVVSRAERAVTPEPGTRYRQLGVRLWGEGVYERESIDGAETKYAKLYRCEIGDIVVNKIWARNGSVGVVSGKIAGAFGSGEFPMFSPNPERLDSNWMHWITKTPGFWFQCDEKSRGTSGKNRIKPEQFLAVEIPLPPLPEQRRIVARIEALAAEIDEAKRLRREAVEEAGALIRSRVSQIDDTLRKQAPPTRVEVLAKRERGSMRSGPFGSALLHDEFVEIGIPAVGIQDVQENRFVLSRRWNVSPEKAKELSRYRIHPDDILITVMGTLGRACVVPADCGEMVSTKHIWTLSLDQSACSPHWLSYWFNYSRRVREDLLGQTTGTAIPGLNGEKIKNAEVPHIPLPEQRRIVAELDALQAKVDALKRLQSETAAELDALLPAILDRAFKGEL